MYDRTGTGNNDVLHISTGIVGIRASTGMGIAKMPVLVLASLATKNNTRMGTKHMTILVLACLYWYWH